MNKKLSQLNFFWTSIFVALFLISGNFFILLYDLRSGGLAESCKPKTTFWELQSIDTMKYSRDLSREKINDPAFDFVIEEQIKNIATVGATHVAIGTPYDEEFLPMLKRWVTAARKYNLKVWFRGNWSGWEGWFDYPPVNRDEHIKKTKDFILNNPELFADGDIFTACPECENGGPGDPRISGDVFGFRKFLMAEYEATKSAFGKIGKQVASNYLSMNGDVANLIMDKETTTALGGIVTIDHYVKTPEELIGDIENIIKKSGSSVVLGEIGIPIPDIHGKMTELEQLQWLDKTLTGLIKLDKVIGLNYWLNSGGSTALWDSQGEAKPALFSLQRFYKPKIIYGVILDELGHGLAKAHITYDSQAVYSREDGYFELLTTEMQDLALTVTAPGYVEKVVEVELSHRQLNIILEKADKDIRFIFKQRLRKWVDYYDKK